MIGEIHLVAFNKLNYPKRKGLLILHKCINKLPEQMTCTGTLRYSLCRVGMDECLYSSIQLYIIAVVPLAAIKITGISNYVFKPVSCQFDQEILKYLKMLIFNLNVLEYYLQFTRFFVIIPFLEVMLELNSFCHLFKPAAITFPFNSAKGK